MLNIFMSIGNHVNKNRSLGNMIVEMSNESMKGLEHSVMIKFRCKLAKLKGTEIKRADK
jgi:hypothetical protein